MQVPPPPRRDEALPEEGVQIELAPPPPKVRNPEDVPRLLSDPRVIKVFRQAEVGQFDEVVHNELMDNAAEIREMNGIELLYFAHALRMKQMIARVLGGAKYVNHYLVRQALGERKLLGEMEELTEPMMEDIAQDLKEPLIRALGGFTGSQASAGKDLCSKILSSMPRDIYDTMSVDDIVGFVKETEKLIKRKFSTGKPQEAMYGRMFLFVVNAGSPARSAEELRKKGNGLLEKLKVRMDDKALVESIISSWSLEWVNSFVLVSHLAESPEDKLF